MAAKQIGWLFGCLAGVACASQMSGRTSGSASSSSGATGAANPVSQTVGASGANVRASDGSGVAIPAGALGSSATITITPTPSATTPANATAVGTPVVFGPEGEQFSAPVTVTLAFDPAKLPSGVTAQQIVIQTAPVGSSSFTALATSVVDSSHVAAQTTHFSSFVPTIGGGSSSGSGSSGGTPFDGTYAGTWTDTDSGSTASGTFTATVSGGVLTGFQDTIASGSFGLLFSAGTVSAAGAVTGTGDAPSQCPGAVGAFTGQIVLDGSGGATLTLAYSRTAAATCAAETGSLTATRTTTGSGSSSGAASTGSATGGSSSSGSSSSGGAPFDGTYAGTWTDTDSGSTASGTFTATVSGGVLTGFQDTIASGSFGLLFSAGTVSAAGAVTGTGDAPSQCPGAVGAFTGQIVLDGSGGATLTLAYSRAAAATCAAETGSLTATRS